MWLAMFVTEMSAIYLQQHVVCHASLLNDQMGIRQQILNTCQVQSVGLDKAIYSNEELTSVPELSDSLLLVGEWTRKNFSFGGACY